MNDIRTMRNQGQLDNNMLSSHMHSHNSKLPHAYRTSTLNNISKHTPNYFDPHMMAGSGQHNHHHQHEHNQGGSSFKDDRVTAYHTHDDKTKTMTKED